MFYWYKGAPESLTPGLVSQFCENKVKVVSGAVFLRWDNFFLNKFAHLVADRLRLFRDLKINHLTCSWGI